MSLPPLSAAVPVYLRIGLLSFGGPAGQIALMQEEIIDRRRWVSLDDFTRGLSVAMVLPGPEAQQLATWLGWRLHGVRGGLAAGLAFVLPGTALMITLAWIAAAFGRLPVIAALFYGVQAAVLVIVARAFLSLARRALKRPVDWALAVAAFIGLWALGLPFPLIIATAAVAGMALPAEAAPASVAHDLATAGGFRPAVRAALPWAIALVAIYLTVRAVFGAEPFDDVAFLFTSAAFVSFGGAYALLPYVADRAVETYGWLSAGQMLNGLAIAEATPGPLILVNTYAGFFAGWDQGGSPGTAIFTALLATFYTFAPSFMLILAAAPYVGWVDRQPVLRRALAGVSAAVVGVVANLAFYLGEAALLPAGEPEWPKMALLLAFAGAAAWRPWPMHVLIIAGAICGLLLLGAGMI